MEKTEKKLLGILQSMEGNGSFASSGTKPFTFPGLHIDGLGETGFPVTAAQAREMIRLARKAPFGKGSQTITDTKVRSAWEIDAGQLSFRHEDWGKFMAGVIQEVKAGLGIEDQDVSASLYKLLIYEKGDFFLPHKDSEKEKGMFGTLIVGLPCTHTGGELLIRFDGRQETVDFAVPAGNYQMPYAAFFADCDHEIKPVTSGYRVCLVYNLVQSSGKGKMTSPQFKKQVDQLEAVLESLKKSGNNWPKAVLLDHQYTPANFSLAGLKRHDKPRATALLAAARQAGYFATMGLVTHYMMGELEGGFYEDDYSYGYRGRGRNRKEEEGTMGEVYETATTIEHWLTDGIPDLGTIHLDGENMLTNFEIGEGAPVEKEEEGYTGNAGMTMQYWYHYGAVILWPTDKHPEVLAAANNSVGLEWLTYYLQNWQQSALQPERQVRELIKCMAAAPVPQRRYNQPDYSPLAAGLAKLKDNQLMMPELLSLLVAVFEHITYDAWEALFMCYPQWAFRSVFQNIADRADLEATDHLLGILEQLHQKNVPAFHAFVLEQVNKMPDYLAIPRITQQPQVKISTAILEKLLALSVLKTENDAWLEKMIVVCTMSLKRGYINDVLSAAIINLSPFPENSPLTDVLLEVCKQELEARIEVKPTPPKDWKREMPKAEDYYGKLVESLRPFMESPTQQVFDYRKNESDRSKLASALSHLSLDLKTETIRKGSPHTLRLTKTQASYERALKNWEEDVALLERLRGKG